MATDLANLEFIANEQYDLAALLPRFSGEFWIPEIGVIPDPIPPIVSVSPTPGSGITGTTQIVVNMTDDANNFKRILLVVDLPGGIKEVAFEGDGATGTFGPKYTNAYNTTTAITNGYSFTLLRDGGWPAGPSVTPYVLDTTGGEAA